MTNILPIKDNININKLDVFVFVFDDWLLLLLSGIHASKTDIIQNKIRRRRCPDTDDEVDVDVDTDDCGSNKVYSHADNICAPIKNK